MLLVAAGVPLAKPRIDISNESAVIIPNRGRRLRKTDNLSLY